MPPDLALLSTLTGSNFPCLELIFIVPKVFEPLKFNSIIVSDPTEKEVVEEPIVDPKHKKRKKAGNRRLKLGLCSQS